MLDAFDTVEKVIFEVIVPAQSDHSGRRVDGETDQRAENKVDFEEHEHAQQIID